MNRTDSFEPRKFKFFRPFCQAGAQPLYLSVKKVTFVPLKRIWLPAGQSVGSRKCKE